MSTLESLLNLFSISSSDALSLVVGLVLSPAKAVGILYGLYKAFSPHYRDNTWEKFVETHDSMDDPNT